MSKVSYDFEQDVDHDSDDDVAMVMMMRMMMMMIMMMGTRTEQYNVNNDNDGVAEDGLKTLMVLVGLVLTTITVITQRPPKTNKKHHTLERHFSA